MREINYEIKKGKKNRNRSRRKKNGREDERGGSNKKKKLKNDLGCCSLTKESFRLTLWCEYVSYIMKHL